MLYCPSPTSPSGNLLAVVFSGWVGYEQPGPEELWLVDMQKQTASYVHRGKCRWWQIFDCDTQQIDPSWSAKEDSIVYGDSIFGVEELAIPSAARRTILSPGSDTYDVVLSPSGNWVLFKRWPGEHGNPNRFDRCLGVVSRDGGKVVHVPVECVSWPYLYSDWHPLREGIATLWQKPNRSGFDLLYWNLESAQSK